MTTSAILRSLLAGVGKGARATARIAGKGARATARVAGKGARAVAARVGKLTGAYTAPFAEYLAYLGEHNRPMAARLARLLQKHPTAASAAALAAGSAPGVGVAALLNALGLRSKALYPVLGGLSGGASMVLARKKVLRALEPIRALKRRQQRVASWFTPSRAKTNAFLALLAAAPAGYFGYKGLQSLRRRRRR